MKQNLIQSNLICGHHITSNKVETVNSPNEILINNDHYSLIVGACKCNAILPPHFHLLSSSAKAHFIFYIDEDKPEVQLLSGNEGQDVKQLIAFLNRWLPTENLYMGMLSNYSMVSIYWNALNPERAVSPKLSIAKPLPRISTRESYVATLYIKEKDSKVIGFSSILSPGQLVDFKFRYNIGETFEGNEIIEISIT